jgi:EpsI family protein
VSEAIALPVSRRDLLLGGVLGGTSALAFALQPRVRESAEPLPLDELALGRVGAFREATPEGFVLPAPGPLTQRTYVDVLTRLYAAEGRRAVMLLIARGRAGDPGMSVHRPERCYRSAGFSIDMGHTLPLPPPFPGGAEAVCMTARREDRVEQVLFWTRVGSSFPVSARAQRLVTFRENLMGVLPSSMLLRLSVIGDEPDGFDLLYRFHAHFVIELGRAARAALIAG